jgi:hypothetical protein
MAIISGLAASFGHNQNGMTRSDMDACRRVADRLNEVIIFRSTGPWAKRWIERGYPSKNFHVKGKSSDWGPHAGFVPYNGTYSKVGYDPAKAAEGTKQNDKGLHSGFAGKTPLILTEPEINDQVNKQEGRPPRAAIQTRFPIQGSKDQILIALRSGDQKEIAFRAVHAGGDRFAIEVYPEKLGANPFRLIDKRGAPLEVMSSNEVGTDRPMTGDYDLLAICPSWGQYGSRLAADVVKPGIQLKGRAGPEPAARFHAGQGLDNVLDPELHTMSKRPPKSAALPAKLPERSEHPDMGNLTPRILRCINELNNAMGAVGPSAALRRVHHNAESHRNAMFGALTEKDMQTIKQGEAYGDGFPFTIFQPAGLCRGSLPTVRYGDVFTVETLAEFKAYAADLSASGFYVPKNWVWGMSARRA